LKDEERLSELEVVLESVRAQAEENLNLAKFHKAEFENFKKRQADATNNAFNDGRAFVLMNVLPMVDALVDAVKSTAEQGLEVLLRKFEGILIAMGVEEVKNDGAFDPYIHNAVQVKEDAGKPAKAILEVWQRGYKMAGRVIRPSMVVINK
jgi:molecular chaperone GrpE